MIKVGIVGYGYWGPNILRNFYNNSEVKVIKCCDVNSNRLKIVKELYPNIEFVTDYKEITSNAEIDAVAVVTPVSTHFEIAIDALKNGKHVFIEKPITSSSAQAEILIKEAEKRNKIIMVDHTFLFTGAVRKIKDILSKGELGELYFFDSVRINLGLFQHDINVVWDLGAHDISIMNYLIQQKVVSVNATGSGHINSNIENIAYLTVNFGNSLIAHFHLNWLSPVKIRKTLICGSKKMLVWDDLDASDKIKIYDKGVDVENKEGAYNLLVKYRSGDMWAPQIENVEALKVEIDYFVESIKNNLKPFNDGIAGLEVVKILEASDKSIKNNGKNIHL